MDGAAERAALDAARERLRNAADIPDPKQQAEEVKWALSSQSTRRIRDCLTLAESLRELATTPGQYDTDPWALNCRNGTLDLRTGELRPHDPAEMHSRQAPVVFDSTAEAPRFGKFLREIFGGDDETIGCMQRAAGLSLSADVSAQAWFLLYGPEGLNGKTTLVNTLRRMMGDYGKALDPSTISFQRERLAGVRDDLATLPGIRFASIVEPSVGQRLSEGLVKAISGGDPICCRPLYGRYHTFTPQAKLWVSCNRRPQVKDTTGAFWRRVVTFPFEVSFKGREDLYLADKLATELSGILNWALIGLLDYLEGGLDPPGAVLAATASYRQEEDPLAGFLGDCTEKDPTGVALAKHLHEAYIGWCEQNGEKSVGRRSFGEALGEKGFRRQRGPGGLTTYEGIRLLEETPWK